MPRAHASAANDEGPAATSSTSRFRSAARSSAKNWAYPASVRPKKDTAGSSSEGASGCDRTEGLGNRRAKAAGGGGGAVSVGMGTWERAVETRWKVEKQKARLG